MIIVSSHRDLHYKIILLMVSAFSVPKAKRYQKYSDHPGPGQYNPENSPKIVKKSDPLYSFGKEMRNDNLSKVPGPGSYQPKENFVADKNPSYSMSPRRQLNANNNPTGPGSYDPSYHYGRQNAPSYSLKGRKSDKYETLPGPGEYQIKSRLSVNDKGHNFPKDIRDRNYSSLVPGPGSYQFQNAVFKYGSKQQPAYGFGSRIQLKNHNNVPGPGQYEPKKEIFSTIGGIVSRDLRDSHINSKTPGPGNYQPDYNSKERLPSWSLSKSSRDYKLSDSVLGPGQYQHDKNYKSVMLKTPSYGFPADKRLKYEGNIVPGPGTYEKPSELRGGIKIAQKLKDLSMSQVPGPGAYQSVHYDKDSWLKGRGRYSISKDPRDHNNSSMVPGPGAYDDYTKSLKSPHGKITFGRDSRSKMDKGGVPGPGHYDLKPFFADVPKYLLPGV